MGHIEANFGLLSSRSPPSKASHDWIVCRSFSASSRVSKLVFAYPPDDGGLGNQQVNWGSWKWGRQASHREVSRVTPAESSVKKWWMYKTLPSAMTSQHTARRQRGVVVWLEVVVWMVKVSYVVLHPISIAPVKDMVGRGSVLTPTVSERTCSPTGSWIRLGVPEPIILQGIVNVNKQGRGRLE